MTMKKILGLLLMLVPLMAAAQSGIEGTWKIDLNKAQLDSKPTVYELKNGMYSCSTCDPKVNIKADGKEHKITGSPYVDSEKITAVSGSTVERVGMKDGKVAFRDTLTISPDGMTMTERYEGHPAGSEQAVMATGIYSRVGEAQAGAHALSGSWKTEKWESASDNVLTFTYSMTNEGVSYKANTGENYSASFDGKDHPFHGDPGTTSVMLTKIDDHTFQETFKRNGEVTGSQRITLSPDGNSLTMVSEDKRRGTANTWVAAKQGSGDTMADK
jgi:hypothetical protein